MNLVHLMAAYESMFPGNTKYLADAALSVAATVGLESGLRRLLHRYMAHVRRSRARASVEVEPAIYGRSGQGFAWRAAPDQVSLRAPVAVRHCYLAVPCQLEAGGDLIVYRLIALD